MEPISVIYILTFAIFLVKALITRLRSSIPDTSLPLNWVGRRNETFSKLRAFMRQHTSSLQTITDGYNKVTIT